MKRTWEVHGRNGHWAVDEHRTGESGTRSTVFISNRRQDAATVAYALNAAYAAGIVDAADVVSRETGRESWSQEAHRAIVGVARVQLNHPCRFCGAESGELHRETRFSR